MQFILLATGEGKKLTPLVQQIVSPMLPLLNQPLMTYPIELLAHYRCSKGFVCLSGAGHTIETHFDTGSRWNLDLTYLLQRQPLGTAGAIKRAERHLTETFLVMPADALIDFDIDAALVYHRSHGGLATVILSNRQEVEHPTECVALNPETQITGAAQGEKGANSYAYTGAFIFEPAIFELIPSKQIFDCIHDLLPALAAADKEVYGYVTDGYWNPILSYRELHEAQLALLEQIGAAQEHAKPIRYFSPYVHVREIAPGIWCEPNVTIHPSAQLKAPLYIAEECQVSQKAELGPNTILSTHSIIDEGAVVTDSTILGATYVGQFVDVKERVVYKNLLIDQATDVALAVTDPFLLGEATPSFAYYLLRESLERLIALVLLVICLPVLLILSLLLWLTAGGAIFERVERIGVRPAMARAASHTLVAPQPITLALLRFRTTRHNESITSVGRWLEQWDLHRLPELWSVVCGEMALTGVKPLTAEEATKITEEWQSARYHAPAGFTGLWYIQAHQAKSFDDLCIADTYHAATISWKQTIWLLRQTPLAWPYNTRRTPSPMPTKASEVRSQPVI